MLLRQVRARAREAAWVEAEYGLDALGPKRTLTLPLGALPPRSAAAAAAAGAHMLK